MIFEMFGFLFNFMFSILPTLILLEVPPKVFLYSEKMAVKLPLSNFEFTLGQILVISEQF